MDELYPWARVRDCLVHNHELVAKQGFPNMEVTVTMDLQGTHGPFSVAHALLTIHTYTDLTIKARS